MFTDHNLRQTITANKYKLNVLVHDLNVLNKDGSSYGHKRELFISRKFSLS